LRKRRSSSHEDDHDLIEDKIGLVEDENGLILDAMVLEEDVGRHA